MNQVPDIMICHIWGHAITTKVYNMVIHKKMKMLILLRTRYVLETIDQVSMNSSLLSLLHFFFLKAGPSSAPVPVPMSSLNSLSSISCSNPWTLCCLASSFWRNSSFLVSSSFSLSKSSFLFYKNVTFLSIASIFARYPET